MAKGSSARRPSIASSRPRSPATRTIPGVTTCRAPRPSAAGAAVGAAVPPCISQSVFPSPSVPPKSWTVLFPGHWEADLMLFAKYGQAILALHERSSRLLLAAKPAGKEALPIANIISSLLKPLPAELRRSVTFDNGTEFARHYELHRLAIETFFCDPYAPMAKGRHRERHRTHATHHPAQDRPGRPLRPSAQRPRLRLQQHPQKMS